MELWLHTEKIWLIDEDFEPFLLFHALPILLSEGDIMAIGCYCAKAKIMGKLSSLEPDSLKSKPQSYTDTFELNGKEHPRGRSYRIPFSQKSSSELCELAKETEAADDGDLFFNHFLAYRDMKPLLPLVRFHAAFYGQGLMVSGHYTKKDAIEFASILGKEPSVTTLQELSC